MPMSTDPHLIRAGADRSGPCGADSAELKAAQETIASLISALKTVRLYPENYPIIPTIFDNVMARFEKFTALTEHLSISIEMHGLAYKGHPVFEDFPDYDIVFSLFNEGLRELTLHKGLTRDELYTLLNIFKLGLRHDNDGKDIVSMIWNADFSHITCTVINDLFDQEAADTAQAQSETADLMEFVDEQEFDLEGIAILDELELELKMIEQGEGGERTGEPPGEAWQHEEKRSVLAGVLLKEKEIDEMARMVSAERETPADQELVALLTRIVRLVDDPQLLDRSCEMLKLCLHRALDGGDIWRAAEIVDFFHRLAYRDPHVSEQVRRAAEDALAAAACCETLETIAEIVRQSDRRSDETLRKYLSCLPPQSVLHVRHLLRHAEHRSTRRMLLGVLEHLGARNIPGLVQDLDREQWYVIRNVIVVLGRISTPETTSIILRFASHPDARVRRECLAALRGRSGEQLMDLFRQRFHDEDPNIRILAISALGSLESAEAADLIAGAVADRSFHGRVFEEKVEMLCALCKSGWHRAGPEIRRILTALNLLRRKAIEDSRRAAAAALHRLANPEAKQLLSQCTRHWHPAVRRACLETGVQ